MGSILVIVTGGAGFIGSVTLELLSEHRERLGIDKVVIVDNLYSGSIRNISHLLESEKFTFFNIDISNYNILIEKLKPILEGYGGPIGIIHLAAIINIVEVLKDPKRGFEVNVNGTLNVLELARTFDVERVVYASSVAVYGEPEHLPIDESHPLKPKNLYGLTKLFSEQLLWRYHEDYGVNVAALRYFNVYGPRMRSGPYAGVVHKFITALLRGEQPIIHGDGEQTRDFVYVYDVAEANVKALKSRVVGAINIGSGRETKINDLYRIICRIISKCPKPKYGPPRKGDVRRSQASIRRARETLNWEPKTPLEKGLKETIKWHFSSPHMERRL